MQLLLDILESERQRCTRRARHRFRRVIIYRQIVRRIVIRHAQRKIFILKIVVYDFQSPFFRCRVIRVIEIPSL